MGQPGDGAFSCCRYRQTSLLKTGTGFLLVSALIFLTTPVASNRSKSNSFIVTSSEESGSEFPEVGSNGGSTSKAEIYSMHIESNIKYRYSSTQVKAYVSNSDINQSSELQFQFVLPQSAFISKFDMEIDGQRYEAYVKEKADARSIYDTARSRGHSTGLVEVNARDANVFNMNVNVKPSGKVVLTLIYEEFLVRKLGHYEQTLNINPKQAALVRDFKVKVRIQEAQNLTLLRVPELRTNEVTQNELDDRDGENRDAKVTRTSPTSAEIEWTPSARDFIDSSSSRKFVVQYDVARPASGGELLLMNGYFIHFFSAQDVLPLRKHVIFVLDVSGSMSGRKIEQLRSAMAYVLDDLKPEDYFNLITFGSAVKGWNPSSTPDAYTQTPFYSFPSYKAPTPVFGGYMGGQFPSPSPPSFSSWSTWRASMPYRKPILATETNLRKAHQFVSRLYATDGTDINNAMLEALAVASAVRNLSPTPTQPTTTISPISEEEFDYMLPESPARLSSSRNPFYQQQTADDSTDTTASTLPPNVESIIVFLTDGEPTVGVTNPEDILQNIRQANRNQSIPIYSLAFGDGADFNFVKKLSLQNFGFARKIYEAADAELQLKGFYKEISSPLLSNVKFKYAEVEAAGGIDEAAPSSNRSIKVNDRIKNGKVFADVTKVNFGKIYAGSELVVAGRLVQPELVEMPLSVSIDANGRNGLVTFDKTKIKEIDLNRRFKYDVDSSNPASNATNTTTSIPGAESFMERLWGYLTIKQLLEKHEAGDDEEESTEFSNEIADNDNETGVDFPPIPSYPKIKEPPKDRALKLSLKYGFVTPLTSLVIVRPNDTSSTPSEPTLLPSSSGRASSTSSFPIARGLAGPPGYGYGNHGSPGYRYNGSPSPPVHSQPYPGLSAARSLQQSRDMFSNAILQRSNSVTHSFKLSPMEMTDAASDDDDDDTWAFQTFTTPVPPPPSPPTPTLAMEPRREFSTRQHSSSSPPPSSHGLDLSLSTISWLEKFLNNFGPVLIGGKSYQVASDRKVPVVRTYNCTVQGNGNGTTSTVQVQGLCRHLKECVLEEFTTDFDLYSSSYFCKLRSGRIRYAGVCCPDKK